MTKEEAFEYLRIRYDAIGMNTDIKYKDVASLLSKIYSDFDDIDYYSIMRSTGYVTDEQAIECEKAIKERINNDRSLFKS